MTPQGNPSGHQPCRIEQGRLHFYGTSHPIHSELLQRLLSLLFTGVVGEGDGNVRWDGKRREIPHSELMKLWDSRDDPGAREARKRALVNKLARWLETVEGHTMRYGVRCVVRATVENVRSVGYRFDVVIEDAGESGTPSPSRDFENSLRRGGDAHYEVVTEDPNSGRLICLVCVPEYSRALQLTEASMRQSPNLGTGTRIIDGMGLYGYWDVFLEIEVSGSRSTDWLQTALPRTGYNKCRREIHEKLRLPQNRPDDFRLMPVKKCYRHRFRGEPQEQYVRENLLVTNGVFALLEIECQPGSGSAPSVREFDQIMGLAGAERFVYSAYLLGADRTADSGGDVLFLVTLFYANEFYAYSQFSRTIDNEINPFFRLRTSLCCELPRLTVKYNVPPPKNVNHT